MRIKSTLCSGALALAGFAFVLTTMPSPADAQESTLKWPSDVGTSHFGTLGNKLEGFSGAWIRPHPGPFVWGWIEKSGGSYNWSGTDRWVQNGNEGAWQY